MTPTAATCELCGHHAGQPFLTLDFSRFGYPADFRLFRCAGCRLLFNAPRLDEQALAAMYEANYYLFLERPRQALSRIVQLHQETVATLTARSAERRLLEVGCAKGWMLALLRAQGWQVQGVELSAHATAYATERLHLPVFQGTLEAWVASADFVPAPAVLCTDVIEHVPDLPAFVSALAAATAPQGLLLIATPNGDARGITSLGPRWLGFNPFHIRFLNRANLTDLLAAHGLQVITTYSYNNLTPQADPGPSRAARCAATLGVLPAVRRLKAGWGDWLDTLARPLAAHIRRAADLAAAAPRYHTTADGRRAEEGLGDNLVVLARRP